MGRGRLSLVAIALLAVVVLLGAAASGQARTGGVEIQRARTSAFLQLGTQRGYEIALYMPSDRVVVFYAVRIHGRGDLFDVEYSLYAARNRGDLRRGMVRARFGSMGRVALRFQGNGRVERDRQPQCEGGIATSEKGRFAGHLSFRGRNGYFHVSSPKGQASLARTPRLRCEKGEALEPQPRSLRKYVSPTPIFPDNHSLALLYASSRSHGRYVGITAVHTEGSPPGAEVQLAVVESRRGMAIGQGAYLQGPRGTLLTSLPGAHPATATLAPPAPFSGKGTYSEEAGAWSGSLKVELPGSTLPLTGPAYGVHLCVANPLKDRDGCEFFKAEPPYDERPARPGWALR